MKKKGIAQEQLVKLILALVVLVVVIAVFYTLFKPQINHMLGIEEETGRQGGDVIDELGDILGKGCEDGDAPRCNPLDKLYRDCVDGKWVKSTRPCVPD